MIFIRSLVIGINKGFLRYFVVIKLLPKYPHHLFFPILFPLERVCLIFRCTLSFMRILLLLFIFILLFITTITYNSTFHCVHPISSSYFVLTLLPAHLHSLVIHYILLITYTLNLYYYRRYVVIYYTCVLLFILVYSVLLFRLHLHTHSTPSCTITLNNNILLALIVVYHLPVTLR